MSRETRRLTALLSLLSWRRTAAEGLWVVDGPCMVDAAEPECISSPSYPSNHADIESCTMHIAGYVPKSLEVVTFDLEDRWSVLDFNAMEFSGQRSEFGDAGRFFTGDMKWSSRRNGTGAVWKICARDVSESFRPWFEDFETYTGNLNYFYAHHATWFRRWKIEGDCRRSELDLDCIVSQNWRGSGASDPNSTCTLTLRGSWMLGGLLPWLDSTYVEWTELDGATHIGTNESFPSHYEESLESIANKTLFTREWENVTITWHQRDAEPGDIGWMICARQPAWLSPGLPAFVGAAGDETVGGAGTDEGDGPFPWMVVVAMSGGLLVALFIMGLMLKRSCEAPKLDGNSCEVIAAGNSAEANV